MLAHPAEDPPPTSILRRQRGPVLGIDRGGWLLFAAQGFTGLGTAPFVVFGPIFQRQLGAEPIAIGVIAALGMVVATLSMLPGTRLAEGYHLRPTILAGWLVSLPAPLLYAVAPHWAFTAAGAVLLGAGVLNTPAFNVYLTLGVPRERLALVMTTVLSAYSLALIGATPLTGVLAQLIGIRWLFVLSFVTFGLASLCVAYLPKRVLPPDAMAGVSYRELTRFPAFMVLLALFSVVTVIIFIPWTFMTLYAREVLRADDVSIGTLMAALYLGSVLMGLCLSRLRRTFGSVAIVLCFEAVYVGSAALILGAGSIPILTIAFFLRGAFWSFRQVMTAVIGEVLPASALAKGYGLFALLTGAAAALAYPIGGWLYMLHPRDPFWVSAAVMLAGMAVTVLVRAYFQARYLPLLRPEASGSDQVLPKAA